MRGLLRGTLCLVARSHCQGQAKTGRPTCDTFGASGGPLTHLGGLQSLGLGAVTVRGSLARMGAMRADICGDPQGIGGLQSLGPRGKDRTGQQRASPRELTGGGSPRPGRGSGAIANSGLAMGEACGLGDYSSSIQQMSLAGRTHKEKLCQLYRWRDDRQENSRTWGARQAVPQAGRGLLGSAKRGGDPEQSGGPVRV